MVQQREKSEMCGCRRCPRDGEDGSQDEGAPKELPVPGHKEGQFPWGNPRDWQGGKGAPGVASGRAGGCLQVPWP